MKLRNKKTGEIMDDVQYRNYSTSDGFGLRMDGKEWEYHSLAELNAEWEDYEEPKEFWFIGEDSCVYSENDTVTQDFVDRLKSIGNYFETEEEAEKAVEKLKAWKRLKDKGFKVDLWDYDGSDGQGRIRTGRILFRVKDYEENDKDLDLLFGGEE